MLSQVDGLVAFRLTASQDRKVLGLWIEGQADRDAGKALLGRLPEKKQREAVVWLPARGILGAQDKARSGVHNDGADVDIAIA